MSLHEQSIAFWNDNQVASFPADVSAADSLAKLNWRNEQYPGLLDLMPVAGFEGKTVIDFGCGPGHDTIMFLHNGAKHVYAVDSSYNGLSYTRARLRTHGFEDRCTTILADQLVKSELPQVDHIHTAGVIHHIEDPVATLRRLKGALKPGAEIRMMVYAAESQFVQSHGGPEAFELIADGAAPIAKAWTQEEVKQIAEEAGLEATYLGGYLMAESEGPGMGGCWSLRPIGRDE